MLNHGIRAFPGLIALIAALALSACALRGNAILHDDLAETVIRRQIDDWVKPISEDIMKAHLNKRGHVYLSFGEGPNSDPSPSFMKRFATDPLPEVRSKSAFRSDGIVINPETGWPGFIIQVDKVTSINRGMAEVQYTMINWQNYSTGYLSKLIKTSSGWQVSETKVLWNTAPPIKCTDRNEQPNQAIQRTRGWLLSGS